MRAWTSGSPAHAPAGSPAGAHPHGVGPGGHARDVAAPRGPRRSRSGRAAAARQARPRTRRAPLGRQPLGAAPWKSRPARRSTVMVEDDARTSTSWPTTWRSTRRTGCRAARPAAGLRVGASRRCGAGPSSAVLRPADRADATSRARIDPQRAASCRRRRPAVDRGARHGDRRGADHRLVRPAGGPRLHRSCEGTADGKEVDAVLVDGEIPAHSSPTPIAAAQRSAP